MESWGLRFNILAAISTANRWWQPRTDTKGSIQTAGPFEEAVGSLLSLRLGVEEEGGRIKEILWGVDSWRFATRACRCRGRQVRNLQKRRLFELTDSPHVFHAGATGPLVLFSTRDGRFCQGFIFPVHVRRREDLM